MGSAHAQTVTAGRRFVITAHTSSEVVTQLHDTNGIVAPLLATLPAATGTDLLTASSLDLHAVTLPASGSLHCEPNG